MRKTERRVGYRYFFTYSEVEYNEDGWVDPSFYKPLTCDLITMKVRIKFNEKVYEFPGWWDGVRWNGSRLNDEDEVLAWKLSPDSDIGVQEDGKPITSKKQRKMKTLPKTDVIYNE